MANENLYPPKTNPAPGTTKLAVGQLFPGTFTVVRAWTNGSAHVVQVDVKKTKRAALIAARAIAAVTGEKVEVA
jgi:VCBS repeat-containing protein